MVRLAICVVDRGAEEDDPLVEQARVDVERALAVHGLLDHHRNQRAHRCSPLQLRQPKREDRRTGASHDHEGGDRLNPVNVVFKVRQPAIPARRASEDVDGAETLRMKAEHEPGGDRSIDPVKRPHDGPPRQKSSRTACTSGRFHER